MSGAVLVAKKRGPKPKADESKVLVTMKVSPAYKEWLLGFAEAQRDIPSRMIDQGLLELAKKFGHKLPPPR
jgi:hypothetical protein